MMGFGEYRIEYYGPDGAVVAIDDEVVSVGHAKEKAERDCRRPDIAAKSWAVVRCVLSSLDGGR